MNILAFILGFDIQYKMWLDENTAEHSTNYFFPANGSLKLILLNIFKAIS